jgi:hypothetical protein
MTIGAADFQSYAQWRDAPMIAQFGASFPAGATFYGPFLIGNFASLAVVATAGGNAAFVQVTFSDDSAGLNAAQTITWSLAANTSMSVAIPALGTYAKVTYNNSGAGASTGTLYMYATNLANGAPYYQAQNSGKPLLAGSVSIGASSSSAVAATQLFAGPALFSVANSATNKWHALVDYWDDALLAFTQFCAFDGTNLALRFTAPLILPPSIINCTIFNDDTAAHNFVWSICAGR